MLLPWQWISLSILWSIIYTISNIIKSQISQYGVMSRCLQAPGELISNIGATILVYWYSQSVDEETTLLLSESKGNESSDSNSFYQDFLMKLHLYLNKIIKDKAIALLCVFIIIYYSTYCIKCIFYEKTKCQRSDDNESSNFNQDTKEQKQVEFIDQIFSWKKSWVFFYLVLANGLSYCTFILAYKQAVIIEMNVGILTWFLSLKPVLTAFFFWLIFRQSLRCVDFIGIVLMISSIIFMSLKIDFSNQDYPKESNSSISDSSLTEESISLSTNYVIIYTASKFNSPISLK